MTKKISQLTAVASLAGTEQFEVNQGGTSKRATADQVATYALGGNQPTMQVTAAQSPYTVLSTDGVLLVNSTAGAVTVTLPTAAGRAGKSYTVKDWKGQAATNAITVATTGGQTIDGSASATISKAYYALAVISDGTNWSVV